ncbi:hypothetical protein CSC12_2269 [Klebsiella michiganensis]|nr:hypothetical protein CSC12_2269 [Klebsiella michiganensis]
MSEHPGLIRKSFLSFLLSSFHLAADSCKMKLNENYARSLTSMAS